MRYLLDIHALIWYFENSIELPPKIKEIICSVDNDLFVSSISLWEIAIKINLGKLKVGFTFEELIRDIKIRDFSILQIDFSMPFIHKDPFDRLLISTALAEKLTIITIDENIQKYDVSWIW